MDASIVFAKTGGLVAYYNVLLFLIMYHYLLIQDPCSVSPCQNDAECVVDQALHGRFYCVCTEGWSGGLCEQPGIEKINMNFVRKAIIGL